MEQLLLSIFPSNMLHFASVAVPVFHLSE